MLQQPEHDVDAVLHIHEIAHLAAVGVLRAVGLEQAERAGFAQLGESLAGHALHLALVVLVGAVHVEELHAGDALEQILAVGPQIEHLLGITVHVEGAQGKRGQQAVGKAVRTVAVGRRAARVDEARALL